MRPLSWLVLVALAAGCIEPEPEVVSGEASVDPEEAVEGALDARADVPADVLEGSSPPAWRVGDWWAFRDGDGREFSVVVVRADANGYVTQSTAARTAAYDALADISYVGRVTRDLAGEQRGEPVTFFRWPLSNGSTWTTTWDDYAVELQATTNPAVAVPGGTAPGFEIAGTVEGRPYVSYSFAPVAGFWSRIAFDNGTFTLDLVEHGSGFEGDVYSGEVRELGRVEAASGPALPPSWEFTVDEEPVLLRVELTADAAAPGLARTQVTGPAGEEATAQALCTVPGGECVVKLTTDLAPATGTGKVLQASTFAGAHVALALGAYATAAAFPAAAEG